MSRVVGESVPRVDAVEKVTGRARYTIDVTVPGCLHGQAVRSQRAHAKLVKVSCEHALAVPGCVAVVTGADLEAANGERRPVVPRFGHIVADHWILANGTVRYFGEPVALVLAETPAAAAEAARLVDVEYEDLPPLMDWQAALAPGAPPIHPVRFARDSINPLQGDAGAEHPNVAYESELVWGDVDGALETAPVVVETTVYYPMLYAYAMEPYNAVAEFRDGNLEVTSTAQHPFQVVRDLARVFGLPLSRVSVRVPYIGGGYGSKSYTKIEPLAAVGAWWTGRPVKLVLSVEESIYTTRADSAYITVRSGFEFDGTLVARDIDIVFDTGAYADNSPSVLDKAVNRCFGPYRMPHLRVSGRAVYTTTSPASSYRGFGAFQGNLAGETNMDQAAARLGMDPFALRRKNLVAKGQELLPGNRPMDADLAADLEVLRSQLVGEREVGGLGDYDASPARTGVGTSTDDGGRILRGVGFGCSASDAGALPTSTAEVRLLGDGSALLLTGATEMGQGSWTVLSQIVADEIGVPIDRVAVAPVDTRQVPFERTTGASRTTTVVGTAVQRACADALERARRIATELGGGDASVERDADGSLRVGGRTVPELVQAWYGPGGGEIVGRGEVRREGAFEALPVFWEIGMVGVEVAINSDTGEVVVDHLVTVADVGKAINPELVEGQDLGAATQGIGGALFEELIYDGPQIANANMVEYRVPRIGDMPRRIDTVLVERGDGAGPYGAKGVGEGARNPVGGAVVAAVARATGQWADRLPLTPERVWRLLQQGAE